MTPKNELPRQSSVPPEAPHGLGGAALANTDPPHAKREQMHSAEVISGEGRGFLRSAPEQVKGLLIKSLAEGHVAADHDSQAADVCARP